MAAFDIPWIDSMSPIPYSQADGSSGPLSGNGPVPPTVAAFSPSNISGTSLASKQRSTIIVHRKSPLLAATPPAVTRALAYSHPFLLPLNRLAGLLSWSSGDPWESFLLVAAFWAVTLYGNVILLWGGPILVVFGLILGLYSRRYSPLSSTGLTGEKHSQPQENSQGASRHHKTLDEIVETLRTFTTRCNVLLEPLREFTDFLSTQRTATSTTTRPALTALLTRIVLVTPIWILLTLPPFYLITMRRVIITAGTVILTWHSKPARIVRVILWRSLAVRRITSMITGLKFSSPSSTNENKSTKSPARTSLLALHPFRAKPSDDHAAEAPARRRRASSSGVRFTFILYENQRRWLGIGWTYSLFAYERAAWTDEHLNPAPSKDEFQLPEVQGNSSSRWRWVAGSEWHVDGVSAVSRSKKAGRNNKNGEDKPTDDGGWIYYDNKWNDGRRGQDGWGRYTRRRRWCRDAELVEISPSTDITPPPSPSNQPMPSTTSTNEEEGKANDENKEQIKSRKRRWFGSGDVKQLSSSFPDSSSISLPNIEGSQPSTGAAGMDLNPSKAPKPSSISSARSLDAGGSSSRNSFGGRRGSRAASTTAETDKESLTRSLRDIEIEEEKNTVDKWGSQPGGAAERAERAWGLGDDAHMGLS